MKKQISIISLLYFLTMHDVLAEGCEPYESFGCFIVHAYLIFLLSLPSIIINSIILVIEYLLGWLSSIGILFLSVIVSSLAVNVSLWWFVFLSHSRNYKIYLMELPTNLIFLDFSRIGISGFGMFIVSFGIKTVV